VFPRPKGVSELVTEGRSSRKTSSASIRVEDDRLGRVGKLTDPPPLVMNERLFDRGG